MCRYCRFRYCVIPYWDCIVMYLIKSYLRRPGVEPGSTAWKATMLTVTPPTQSCFLLASFWFWITEECLYVLWQHFYLYSEHHTIIWNKCITNENPIRFICMTRHLKCFLLTSCLHRWFSGRILACHAGGPGSIPGRCINFYNMYRSWFYNIIFIYWTTLQLSTTLWKYKIWPIIKCHWLYQIKCRSKNIIFIFSFDKCIFSYIYPLPPLHLHYIQQIY